MKARGRAVAAFAGLIVATALLAPIASGASDRAVAGVDGAPTFHLDRGALSAELRQAPAENSRRADSDPARITLPAPDGSRKSFELATTEVMAPKLAGRHPEIKTYAGRGVDDPASSIRITDSPLGFQASVRGGELGSWYVDPVRRGEQGPYSSYYGPDLANRHGPLDEGAPEGSVPKAARLSGQDARSRGYSNGTTLRTYRLALISDPSYAAYFGPEDVTDAKVALLNRVDQIYESELSIRMVLIGDNDQLNLNTAAEATGANGPCGAEPCYDDPDELMSCSGDTLDRNRVVADRIVGDANYDIGHLALGRNGGGLAGLGVVGRADKAAGCTGVPRPDGDYYAVDYVSHEMGHQFGANHSFNGTDANCSGDNRNPGTSVEPGSGSSIMAYAGICGDDNLQPHSDPYFSQRSFEEIISYVRVEPGGGNTATATGDTLPDVYAGQGGEIPDRTPFTLRGSGSDPDGPVSLMWEQNDPGLSATSLVDPDKRSGPLFRQFGTRQDAALYDEHAYDSPGENHTGTDPARTFPDLDQILANNTNAETGDCPGAPAPKPPAQGSGSNVPDRLADCYSEFLPTAAYVHPMHFRLTARDGSGGVASDDVTMTPVPGTGPFLVNYPNNPGVSWIEGSTRNVKWDPAGSSGNGIDAQNVDISLSTDGGQTFPIRLAERAANDGSQMVTLPSNLTTDRGRIRIQSRGLTSFFDVSNSDFQITKAPNPIVAERSSLKLRYGAGAKIRVVVSDPDVPGSNLALKGKRLPRGFRVKKVGSTGPAAQPGTATFVLRARAVKAKPKRYHSKLKVKANGSTTGSARIEIKVREAKAKLVRLRAKPHRLKRGHRAAFKVKAKSPHGSIKPVGRVRFLLRGRTLGTAKVRHGVARLKRPHAALRGHGRARLKAKFHSGSGRFSNASAKRRVRIR